MEKNIAIVFMAAGISSRFGGKIKQFACIGPNGETLIEYSINQAIKSGFNKIIFIVGNKTAEPFKSFFGSNYKNIPVFYALQKFDSAIRDKPWGTCDALCSIKNIIDCPFVICNGDDIYGEKTFKQLINHLNKQNNEATIGFRLADNLPNQGSANRAIFETEKGFVKNIAETFNIVKSNLSATNTKPDDLCSMNIFALYPSTVAMLNERLNEFKKKNSSDKKAECLLPDELSSLIKSKKINMKIYSAKEKVIGITYPEDETKVAEMIANR